MFNLNQIFDGFFCFFGAEFTPTLLGFFVADRPSVVLRTFETDLFLEDFVDKLAVVCGCKSVKVLVEFVAVSTPKSGGYLLFRKQEFVEEGTCE